MPEMETSDVSDLLNFLKKDVKEELKIKALNEILCLTGSESGCELLQSNNDIGNTLLEDSFHENEIISKLAIHSLINISATLNGANFIIKLIDKKEKKISMFLNCIFDAKSKKADSCCMVLSNLTRSTSNANLVMEWILKFGFSIEEMIKIFTQKNFNSNGCNLNYLGALFSNLSQTHKFREDVMQENNCLVKKLFPFVNFHESPIRKKGIVGTLRNCCFEADYHKLLLQPDTDILSCLLFPLAGPEEFDDEDNEKLPVDLQYLDEDKKREEDPDIRKMLLEALLQLCATKFGREFLRRKNAYVILREYHKWENNKSALLACENIVDILIRTEEEINEDNLKELDIPNDLLHKFEKLVEPEKE